MLFSTSSVANGSGVCVPLASRRGQERYHGFHRKERGSVPLILRTLHSELGSRCKRTDVPTIRWRETFDILISRPPGLGQTRRAMQFLDPDVASYTRASSTHFISHVTALDSPPVVINSSIRLIAERLHYFLAFLHFNATGSVIIHGFQPFRH